MLTLSAAWVVLLATAGTTFGRQPAPVTRLEVQIVEAKPNGGLDPDGDWFIRCRVVRAIAGKLPRPELTLLVHSPSKTFGMAAEELPQRRFVVELADPVTEPYRGRLTVAGIPEVAAPRSAGAERTPRDAVVGKDRIDGPDARKDDLVAEAFGSNEMGSARSAKVRPAGAGPSGSPSGQDGRDSGPGLAPAQLRMIIKSRRLLFRDCYRQAADKGVRGDLTVSFTVTAAGSTKDVKLQASPLASSAAATCVLEALRRVRFTPTDRPTAATHVFTFPPSD